jgi:L-ascorbate metabolism protein UlaG (beta-lactamase superfamily)
MPKYEGLRKERVQASKQFHDGVFRNTSGLGPALQGSFFKMTGEFLFGSAQRVPKAPLPVDNPLQVWASAAGKSELRVTWLGHSTVLLESDGVRVLTDPVFGDRASPVSFAGAKRFHPLPASIEQLPPLDAVLLSHDHYDHLCATSIQRLAKLGVPIVTSLGVGARLERMGFDPQLIHELDWWEQKSFLGGDLTFDATPAQHFSGRSLTDRNQTLWSSWVISTRKRRIFFSGDTGLTQEFAEVHQRFGAFDLVMLEVGAWNASWGNIHLGPVNALQAFEWLGGGTLLPVHWGTFDLAMHAWDEPAETLLGLAEQRGARILTPILGRPFIPAQVEGPNPWWRAVREGMPQPLAQGAKPGVVSG